MLYRLISGRVTEGILFGLCFACVLTSFYLPSYFMVLLLTCQFEDAVAYLWKLGGFWEVDAMHVALFLVYYGLLRVECAGLHSIDIGMDNCVVMTRMCDF